MRRPILLAAFLGLGGVVCERAAAPPPQAAPSAPGAGKAAAPVSQVTGLASPIAVFVVAEAQEAPPSALAQEWVKQLEAAFAANPAQFKLVKAPGEAEVMLHIKSAVPAPDAPDHAVMSGSILMGKTLSSFRLDYTGGPAAMAGRFAKHLSGQVQAARASFAKKPGK